MKTSSLLNLFSSALFVLFAILTVGAPALGDEGGADFSSSVLSRSCRDRSSCVANGFVFEDLLNRQGVAPVIRGLLPKFYYVVGLQVDLWADSILETNVEVDGLPILDRVEGVYKNGELRGYRITYSAPAWRLDGNNERTEQGRVVEAAFVEISLNKSFRDEAAVATFTR
jgi:hypothetical protein